MDLTIANHIISFIIFTSLYLLKNLFFPSFCFFTKLLSICLLLHFHFAIRSTCYGLFNILRGITFRFISKNPQHFYDQSPHSKSVFFWLVELCLQKLFSVAILCKAYFEFIF